MASDFWEALVVDGLANGGSWPRRTEIASQISNGPSEVKEAGFDPDNSFFLSSAAHQFKKSKLTSVNIFEFSKFVNSKILTKLEKSKSLRAARKRLGWGQRQMADALGLDPTYLSQLENGRRDVDDWYIIKAEEIVQGIEKSKEVKVAAVREEPLPYKGEDLRARCHLYLNKILDECRDNPDQLAWTYVELQKRFPLKSSTAAEPGGISSTLLSGVGAAAVSEAESRYAQERANREQQPLQKADAPTEKTGEPSTDTSKTSKAQPLNSQGKAPR